MIETKKRTGPQCEMKYDVRDKGNTRRTDSSERAGIAFGGGNNSELNSSVS
jgi:hypothetical protein